MYEKWVVLADKKLLYWSVGIDDTTVRGAAAKQSLYI